jgi:hypothetical protein
MHRTQGLFSSPVNQFVPTTGLRIHFSGNRFYQALASFGDKVFEGVGIFFA